MIQTHGNNKWAKVVGNSEVLGDVGELEMDFMERRAVKLADFVVANAISVGVDAKRIVVRKYERRSGRASEPYARKVDEKVVREIVMVEMSIAMSRR